MDKKQIIAIAAMVIIALGTLFGYDALREDVTAGAESYEVSAQGYGGEVRLEVFISGEEIVEIRVLEQSETEGLGDIAIDEVIAEILEANSTDVEVVSGATVSANAAIAAVNDALAQAGLVTGDVYNVVVQGYGGDIVLDVIIHEGEIVAINITEDNETQGIGDTAMDVVVADILTAQSTDVDTVAGATVSSEAVISGVEQALEDAGVELGGGAHEQQGVLGTGSGYGGDIVLDVVVENGEIIEIFLVEESETPGIGDTAIAEMIEKIVEAGSTDVDVISGATVSSNGTINAVEDALENGEGESASEGDDSEEEEAAEEYEPQGTLGTARGYGGDIVLDVITDGDEIVDIVVVEESETPRIGDTAIAEIIEAVLAAQSTDVDIVSGATLSSEGAINAIEDGLGQ